MEYIVCLMVALSTNYVLFNFPKMNNNRSPITNTEIKDNVENQLQPENKDFEIGYIEMFTLDKPLPSSENLSSVKKFTEIESKTDELDLELYNYNVYGYFVLKDKNIEYPKFNEGTVNYTDKQLDFRAKNLIK